MGINGQYVEDERSTAQHSTAQHGSALPYLGGEDFSAGGAETHVPAGVDSYYAGVGETYDALDGIAVQSDTGWCLCRGSSRGSFPHCFGGVVSDGFWFWFLHTVAVHAVYVLCEKHSIRHLYTLHHALDLEQLRMIGCATSTRSEERRVGKECW